MPTKRSVHTTNCQDCAIRTLCTLGRLETQERALVESKIGERIFHRDDVLVEENKVAGFVRIVKTGTVFAYRRGLDGRSRPIGVVSRGRALGTFSIFNRPNPASCVALTTIRVCELPVVALRDISACGSNLLAHITLSVVDNFAALTAWSEAMRLPGVINQLAYILVLLADANRASIVELPSHSALAELLGTRRETVARALGALEMAGGIRRHERKRCEVLRSPLLARLSPATR
jgi:CRP/FNR family cyclic AMP-dependent transcriptional regulator